MSMIKCEWGGNREYLEYNRNIFNVSKSDLFESLKEVSNMLRPLQFSIFIWRRHHQCDVLAEVSQLQGGADWVCGVTFCCQDQDRDVQDLKLVCVFTIIVSKAEKVEKVGWVGLLLLRNNMDRVCCVTLCRAWWGGRSDMAEPSKTL